jgi:hypothetical protein
MLKDISLNVTNLLFKLRHCVALVIEEIVCILV